MKTESNGQFDNEVAVTVSNHNKAVNDMYDANIPAITGRYLHSQVLIGFKTLEEAVEEFKAFLKAYRTITGAGSSVSGNYVDMLKNLHSDKPVHRQTAHNCYGIMMVDE